jgi:hypothetical protein
VGGDPRLIVSGLIVFMFLIRTLAGGSGREDYLASSAVFSRPCFCYVYSWPVE